MSEQKQVAHISGRYVLAAAIVAGVFGGTGIWLGWWLNRDAEILSANVPSSSDGPLVFTDLTVIPQPVNAFFIQHVGSGALNIPENVRGTGTAEGGGFEESTFEITVHNNSENDTTIKRIEFVPTKIKNFFDSENIKVSRTLVAIEELNHDGHIAIPFESLLVDEAVSESTNIVVAGRKSETFTVWFKYTKEQPMSPVCDVPGLLRLISDSGKTVQPITLRLRPDDLAPYGSYSDDR